VRTGLSCLVPHLRDVLLLKTRDLASPMGTPVRVFTPSSHAFRTLQIELGTMTLPPLLLKGRDHVVPTEVLLREFLGSRSGRPSLPRRALDPLPPHLLQLNRLSPPLCRSAKHRKILHKAPFLRQKTKKKQTTIFI